jgi:hypothetical protein
MITPEVWRLRRPDFPRVGWVAAALSHEMEIVMKACFVNVAAALPDGVECICQVGDFHHLKKSTKACLGSLHQ